jgi:phosphoesterase RecJ-like protein
MNLSAVADLIRQAAGPIVVLTHAKPDGDAFGSVVAMAAALRSMGRDVRACFAPPVPASLAALRGSELAKLYDQATGSADLDAAALYIVLDTGAWGQLGPFAATIRPNLDRTLIIDHHLSGDIPAAHRYIDGCAAACCEIVAQFIDELLTPPIAEPWASIIREALFVGIVSDTGWFRFSNTRPHTHELAAKLLREGVDQDSIHEKLEQGERPEKLALLTRALDSLKLLADGKAALMVLRGDDFQQTGALEEETERLIDIPQQIGTVRVIALISERTISNGMQARPQTRLSFRSKPGPNAVNVAELAHRFGGGGHARAAGAKVDAPLEDVVQRVSAALNEAVANGA